MLRPYLKIKEIIMEIDIFDEILRIIPMICFMGIMES
jgi:hypothetical protein